MEVEKISRGVTFEGIGSTFGLFIFVFGLLLTAFGVSDNFSLIILTVAAGLILFGLLLFLSIKGVQIDFDKKIIRLSKNFFLFKFGRWKSHEPYDKIVLRYFNESRTHFFRGIETHRKTRSFDIYLTSPDKPDLLIKEFGDYDEAETFLAEYSKKLNKVKINMYEEIKQQVQKRRQHTRR